jgi:hypothetical protein
LTAVSDILKDSLFTVMSKNGDYSRYVFGPDGKRNLILVSEEELDNMRGKFISDYSVPKSKTGIFYILRKDVRSIQSKI